jgi:hypothetical protein
MPVLRAALAGGRPRLLDRAPDPVGDEGERRRVEVRPARRRRVGHHEGPHPVGRAAVPAVGEVEEAASENDGGHVRRGRSEEIGGCRRRAEDPLLVTESDVDVAVAVPVQQGSTVSSSAAMKPSSESAAKMIACPYRSRLMVSWPPDVTVHHGDRPRGAQLIG